MSFHCSLSINTRYVRALSELSTLEETRLATEPELTSVFTWHARPRDDWHVDASLEDWIKYSLPLLLLPVRSGVVTEF